MQTTKTLPLFTPPRLGTGGSMESKTITSPPLCYAACIGAKSAALRNGGTVLRPLADATLLRGGLSAPRMRACWLFNMCRADMALQTMGDTLRQSIEQLVIFYEPTFAPTIVPDKDDFLQAARFLFSIRRLGLNGTAMSAQASALLLKGQLSDGGWPSVAGENGDLETTASAIHALALDRPRGWQRSVNRARDWLLSIQSFDGLWQMSYELGSVWGTVLRWTQLSLRTVETT